MKSSIKSVIITGCFGIVIGVIGTFGASSVFKNTINNTITVNGEKVSTETYINDYNDVVSENKKLIEEKNELEIQNEDLKSRILSIGDIPDITYKDLGLIINGDSANINKIKSLAIIDDQRYYSENFIMGLINGQVLNYDGNDENVYVGNRQYERMDFVNNFDAYESFGLVVYKENNNDTFMMSGEKRSNGITLEPHYSDDAYAIFNIQGKYSSLEASIGHVDGSNMRDTSLIVLLDGKMTKEIPLKAEDMAYTTTIQLNGAKQLKLLLSNTGGNSPIYGLSDIKIE